MFRKRNAYCAGALAPATARTTDIAAIKWKRAAITINISWTLSNAKAKISIETRGRKPPGRRASPFDPVTVHTRH